MNAPESLSRRDCLLRGLTSLVAIPVCLAVAGPSVATAAPPANALSEDNPTAKALGYVADATKTDIKKFPKRAGANGANQFCSTCQFYQANAKAEWGPCAIFPNQVVSGQGWCNSWVVKPG
jgi:hypothetical protein